MFNARVRGECFMNTIEHTAVASLFDGNKITKGYLKISKMGYSFVSEQDTKQERRWDWRYAEYHVGQINMPVFLFVSTKKNYISFRDATFRSFRFILDDIDRDKIIDLIKKYRKELEERDEKTKLQVTRDIHNKQQKIQEAICNDVCDDTVAESTTFVCEQYDVDNPLVKDLMHVVSKYHYDFEEETDGILIFNFLAGLISAEDPSVFLDNNCDLLNEIEVLLNFANVSANSVKKFEKLIDVIANYEFNDEEYLCDILEQIYSEISNVYHSDIRATHRDKQETKESIELEWWEVKRKLREEESKYRREKYEAVMEYITKQKYPFKKEQIKKATGAPDGVIHFVFRNETKIVNYYREYIWYDNLGIGDEEEQKLLEAVEGILDDYEVHHIQELYETLSIRFMSFFKRVMITTPYRLLGVLRVMQSGKNSYKIEQPYIAAFGTRITTAQERLEDYIRYKEKVAVSDILQYARDNYMNVQSIVELLNSLNRTHMFLNKYEMIRNSKVIVSYEMEKQIIKVFEKELEKHNGLMAICQMELAHELPDIDYEWNEWLLYSIMRKSKKYPTVFLSSNTYKEAVPMVTSRYQYEETEVTKIADECKNRQLKVADNMNNIDELLEDMIDEFIEDIEF